MRAVENGRTIDRSAERAVINSTWNGTSGLPPDVSAQFALGFQPELNAIALWLSGVFPFLVGTEANRLC